MVSIDFFGNGMFRGASIERDAITAELLDVDCIVISCMFVLGKAEANSSFIDCVSCCLFFSDPYCSFNRGIISIVNVTGIFNEDSSCSSTLMR